jgi:hypothetical protein
MGDEALKGSAVKISKVDGGDIRLDLAFLAGSERGQALDRAFRAVTMELKHRRDIQSGIIKREVSGSDLEPNDWFKTACYVLLRHILREDDAEPLLDARISKLGRGKRGRKPATLFQKGMMAIVAHEKGERGEPKSEMVGRRDRERFGTQLEYAFRHKVPPAFLRCFTMTYGKRAARAGEASNHIEPEFLEWIADSPVDDDLDPWIELPQEAIDAIQVLKQYRKAQKRLRSLKKKKKPKHTAEDEVVNQSETDELGWE